MDSVYNVVFSHVFIHDPTPEDAGTIRINANIIGGVDTLTFTTTSLIEKFLDEDDCQSKQDVNYFLMEAELNDDVIWNAMNNLVFHVEQVTDAVSIEDLLRSCLEVKMDVLRHEPSDLEIEEAIRASLNQTNNIRFRPASKLVVKSLTRKIYDKTSSLYGDKCTICLEEFNNGTRLVTLPCGHEFDEECMGKWFETSHVCPLCRFELPCED